jgi:hypothetical protein
VIEALLNGATSRKKTRRTRRNDEE